MRYIYVCYIGVLYIGVLHIGVLHATCVSQTQQAELRVDEGSLKDAFEVQQRPPQPPASKPVHGEVLDRHIIQSEQEAMQLAQVNQRLVCVAVL